MLIEKEPQHKKKLIPNRRFTKHLDGITGATRLQPLVLEVMAAFHTGGLREVTDSRIQIGLKITRPESPSGITTVCRALDGLEAIGVITKRHVFATEAAATKIHTGSYYQILNSKKTSGDLAAMTKEEQRIQPQEARRNRIRREGPPTYYEI